MKKEIGRVFLIWFFVFLGLFVLLNIFFSQNHPSLMSQLLTREEKVDAVSYLSKIKKQKNFSSELAYFKSIYGQNIEVDIWSQDVKRKGEISRLESILNKNPESRDILVYLSILYFLDDNKKMALFYYGQAHEIDPELKIDEIEKLR